MERSLRYAWAAPWSLLGLVLSVFFRKRYVTKGVILAEGAAWPRKFGWRYRAITLGHVVLAVDELDEKTMRHELAHVHQYERWGPLFVPAYLVASLWMRLHGKHHYSDNPFELAARDAEGHLE